MVTGIGMTRKFSIRQKTALYLYAHGRCANPGCGHVLVAGWHADHKRPWSQGGETTLRNGAALCPRCNILKSNRQGGRMEQQIRRKEARGENLIGTAPMTELEAVRVQLRHWQRRSLRRWLERTGNDFLLVATPGAGKTIIALRIALYLLDKRDVHR